MTDEGDETRELGAVLRRVHRAPECLLGHAVLQERQPEGWYCMHWIHGAKQLEGNVIYIVIVPQDVMRGSDMELDGMFKLSFAYDIINVSQRMKLSLIKFFQILKKRLYQKYISSHSRHNFLSYGILYPGNRVHSQKQHEIPWEPEAQHVSGGQSATDQTLRLWTVGV